MPSKDHFGAEGLTPSASFVPFACGFNSLRDEWPLSTLALLPRPRGIHSQPVGGKHEGANQPPHAYRKYVH